MADLVAGLIGIGGTLVGIFAAWGLGRRTKESDDLRSLYAGWASEAHNVLTTVESVREGAEGDAVRQGVPIDVITDFINEDSRAWHGTGIDRAKIALEKARFKIAMSDANDRRVKPVVEQTERLMKLNPSMSYEELDAAKKELEALVTGQLRSSFRLRSLLED